MKLEFTTWTKDAWHSAKGVGLFSAFVTDPPQYIPVGDLNTYNSMLVARRHSRERVQIHTDVELPVDGSQEQERYYYTAQVYLAKGSVGRYPCVVRPSNEGDHIRPISTTS